MAIKIPILATVLLLENQQSFLAGLPIPKSPLQSIKEIIGRHQEKDWIIERLILGLRLVHVIINSLKNQLIIILLRPVVTD